MIIKMNFISKITLRESNFNRFRCVFYAIKSCILKKLRYNEFDSRDIVLINNLLYKRRMFNFDNWNFMKF